MQSKNTTTLVEPVTTNKQAFILSGHPNFRDLGGYKNLDGNLVKKGLIYRSSALTTLSKEDTAMVESLNIKTVIDFRSTEEIQHNNQILPHTVTKEEHLSIDPGNISSESIKTMIQKATSQSVDDFMIAINEHIVLEAQEQYRNFFKLIEQDSNASIVFNCTAGKDRTGLAAALFLWALKVDQQTIIEDYLKSNDRLQPSIDAIVLNFSITDPKTIETIHQMYAVKQTYLLHAFDMIEKEFDSIDNFLYDVLQVNQNTISKIYLE